MSCSNCYNGCSEIISDQCVKYTGVDIPLLGIKNGDSLSYITQSLVGFLSSTLDGSGIKIDIPQNVYCTLVSQYLPVCGDISLIDILTALIKASCSLQTQIDDINTTLSILNASYTTSCLSGVDSTSKTHAVLQAVITKLCSIDSDLTALTLDVSTNYVKLSDLNALIAAYLSSLTPGTTQQYLKMIPYTAMEYYGSLSNFDGSGKGISGLGWDKIYLCNGNNGTPDKRGRVGVGVIQGVGGGAMNPNVDPAFSTNPNYTLGMLQGINAVTLTSTQIPAHSHTITDPGHSHTITGYVGGGSHSFAAGSGNFWYLDPKTSTEFTGITGTNSFGGGLSHTNIQPVLACYYIIYLP